MLRGFTGNSEGVACGPRFQRPRFPARFRLTQWATNEEQARYARNWYAVKCAAEALVNKEAVNTKVNRVYPDLATP